MSEHIQSERSKVVVARTYARWSEEHGQLEDWQMIINNRLFAHQEWLWKRAVGRELTKKETSEIREFCNRGANFMCAPSGRTCWMADQEIGKKREISHFNCAGERASTVYDMVDFYWGLLNGAGMGDLPVAGSLSGFSRHIKEIEIIPSLRMSAGGEDFNTESYDPVEKKWVIRVGDSAEAWAKALGKLLAGKRNVKKLVLDFSQIRPAGIRLKGYGWISSGYEPLAKALKAIAEILNRRSTQLLRLVDLFDICNHLGETLASRRSAIIQVFDYLGREYDRLASFKKDYWITGDTQRRSSNNTTVIKKKPTLSQFNELVDLIISNGGSDPGILNEEQMLIRAPWAQLTNPCGEILLPDGGVCNLTETNLNAPQHKASFQELMKTVYYVARANYRQTLVDFRDGILQEKWHLNNEFLHLCGVGATACVQRNDLSEYEIASLRRQAIYGAYSMADELDQPRPKNVTTIKPSGTMSKVFDTTEGVHAPLGKYILNNIVFSSKDPIVDRLINAGYNVFQHPSDSTSVLATFPVEYNDVEFSVHERKDGKKVFVNAESAVEQLNRYKKWMTHWCDQNVSCTISYDPSEKKEIANWLNDNWDSIVGLSFLFRNDPTKTAADLGHPYLPQEVVWEEKYRIEKAKLKPIDFKDLPYFDDAPEGEECLSGHCPMK